jgi:hypothetical protein
MTVIDFFKASLWEFEFGQLKQPLESGVFAVKMLGIDE